MRELSIEQMEMIQGGKISWKCILGIVAVATGIVLASTGVGTVVAGSSIGGGLGLIGSQC